ncbi:MAG: nuclear transport factor 2 family protein [Bacteroidota bacterium]
MKNLIILSVLLAAFCLSGCQAPTGSEGKNLAVVQAYVDAVKNEDFDKMQSLLADDYLGLGPSLGDSINKEGALASWKYNSENLYESMDFELTQLLETSVAEGPAQGDWVSNWSLVTITYQDGRGPVSLWVNVVYKIENGKIARSRTFYNEADVYEQLGYRIFPPLQLPEEEEG